MLHSLFSTFGRSAIILCCFFFFFNDTATTEIYTLSLHDALPISEDQLGLIVVDFGQCVEAVVGQEHFVPALFERSEEHTSELQSHLNLVCRLLLEKKKEREIARSRELKRVHPRVREQVTVHLIHQ